MSSHSDTKFTITKDARIPAGLAVAAIIAAISGTWYFAELLGVMNRKLDTALADRWTATDMELWAFRLREQNTQTVKVPDPRQMRAERAQGR